MSDSVVFPLRSAAVDCVGARRCWRGGEDQRKMCGKIKYERSKQSRGGTRGSTPADVMRADENTDSKTAAARDGGLKMGLMERMFALC